MPSHAGKQQRQSQQAAVAADTGNESALDVEQIVGGARDERAIAKRERRFARSNRRHRYADAVVGTTVYTLSALQHFSGQSNALTLLSMWVAGTTYFMNYALRRYLQPVQQIQPPPGTGATQGSQTPATAATGTMPASMTQQTQATNTNNLSAVAMLGMPLERHKVFQLEAVGSWVWMLAAFQQFRVHQRLRWCGYNSWLALCAAAYFSTRHIFSVMAN